HPVRGRSADCTEGSTGFRESVEIAGSGPRPSARPSARDRGRYGGSMTPAG
ncbi:unnamed protein product, partial [Polarella glacialis]